MLPTQRIRSCAAGHAPHEPIIASVSLRKRCSALKHGKSSTGAFAEVSQYFQQWQASPCAGPFGRPHDGSVFESAARR